MRTVQKKVPPPFRGTAGNHGRRSTWTIAADRLTIPGGELPWTAEVRHNRILARAGCRAAHGVRVDLAAARRGAARNTGRMKVLINGLLASQPSDVQE